MSGPGSRAYAETVSRLYAWIQRHPKLIDSIPAVFLLAIGLGSLASSDTPSGPWRLLDVPLMVAVTVPLIFRRRWPRGTCVPG
jgi:hypothetical protein